MVGRLNTRELPACLPLLLSPPKSLAGFTAATVTSAAVALGFLGFIMPIRNGGHSISCAWQAEVRQATINEPMTLLPYFTTLKHLFVLIFQLRQLSIQWNFVFYLQPFLGFRCIT